MPTYRYRLGGPRDQDVSMAIGVPVASNPIEPALTKDYTIENASDEPALRESLGFTGWSFVEEVIP